MGITRNSNRVNYGIKHFIADTEDDIQKIPLLSTTLPDSTVFVIEDSSTYVLTRSYEWVKVITASSGGTGGDDSNGDDDDNTLPDDGGGGNTPPPEDDEEDDEIIYDGTEI